MKRTASGVQTSAEVLNFSSVKQFSVLKLQKKADRS